MTVEALKERWDCSFAYVFCSVASVNSKKNVEQLLGRVLRMPYAKRRKQADLNRAYAHVSRASWPNAVNQLHDRLVDMGFEDAEANAFVEKMPELDLAGGGPNGLFADAPPPPIVDLPKELSPAEWASVKIEQTEGGSRVTFTGALAQETVARLMRAAPSAAARARIEGEAKRHRAVWQKDLAPAQRGVPFRVHQLCFSFDGALELAEREDFLRSASDEDLNKAYEHFVYRAVRLSTRSFSKITRCMRRRWRFRRSYSSLAS